jgi:nitroreductase / dihydropteridine reductase
MSTLIEKLGIRYATKKMTGEKISSEELNTILEAIRLTPTSLGLQPLKVLVLESEEAKASIKAACYGQSQITDGSQVLVFAVYTEGFEALTEKYIQNIADTRSVPVESLNDFKQMILGHLKNLSIDDTIAWAKKQAYIALGFGLVAAAEVGVDSTPMEGFNPAAVDEILGLKAKGLASTVILALGKKDVANDYLANAKKVRRASADFFEFI